MAKSKVSMKLLIDTKGKRVLFAEANKECVDFLFQLLSLPVAAMIDLLRDEGMEGSLPNLHRSLENLNHTYILPGKKKDSFLEPVSSVSIPLLEICNDHKLIPDIDSHKCPRSYTYSYDSDYYSPSSPRYIQDDPSKLSCPKCGEKYPMVAEDSGGLVKGVVNYMVMDDLAVEPMSTISSLTLLNRFNVKDVAALQEKVVTLGFDEAVKLLKTSLQSKTVLTDVFC